MSVRILTWPAGPASVKETFSNRTDGSAVGDGVMKAFGMRGRALSAYGLLALIVNLTGFSAAAAPVRLLAFGDSLTAGYNLPPGQSFADQLESALKAKGYDRDSGRRLGRYQQRRQGAARLGDERRPCRSRHRRAGRQ
jgi:hypothetical protein